MSESAADADAATPYDFAFNDRLVALRIEALKAAVSIAVTGRADNWNARFQVAQEMAQRFEFLLRRPDFDQADGAPSASTAEAGK